ncbi:hypothetical protein J7E89_03330 [Streptomyces sp. ISL-100]|nr:hypothetical protein [Streptomyces sp. ISL-100]
MSLARVAKEFGVTAVALYRYVPGKTELIDLMVDLAIGPPAPVAAIPGGWRPQLTEWARQCLTMYRRNPWILTATACAARSWAPTNWAGWRRHWPRWPKQGCRPPSSLTRSCCS